METLKEKIDIDIKSAMLSKDNIKRDILRVIKAEISREEGGLKTLNDDGVIKLIKKSVKNLEVINTDASKDEIKILESYLPEQMSPMKLHTIITQIVVEIGYAGPKDMGRIISAFNSRYPGASDGKTIAETIKNVLSNN